MLSLKVLWKVNGKDEKYLLVCSNNKFMCIRIRMILIKWSLCEKIINICFYYFE